MELRRKSIWSGRERERGPQFALFDSRLKAQPLQTSDARSRVVRDRVSTSAKSDSMVRLLRTRAGMPSAQPHAGLQLAGTGVFGTPRNPIRRYIQYRCTACGCWMHQNTLAGTPPGAWSVCNSNVPAVELNQRRSASADGQSVTASIGPEPAH
jgi:hypothetical protein